MTSASYFRSSQSSKNILGQTLTLVGHSSFRFHTLKRAVHRRGRVDLRSEWETAWILIMSHIHVDDRIVFFFCSITLINTILYKQERLLTYVFNRSLTLCLYDMISSSTSFSRFMNSQQCVLIVSPYHQRFASREYLCRRAYENRESSSDNRRISMINMKFYESID